MENEIPLWPKHEGDIDNAQSKSKFVLIGTITIVVVVMVLSTVAAILVYSKAKDDSTSRSRSTAAPTVKEFSSEVTIESATINGKIGEANLPPYNAEAEDIAIGKIIPSFSANEFSGGLVSVVPGDGPYMLAFLAHWCIHCQREVPLIVDLYESGEIPDDVTLIAIATSTSPKNQNYPPSKWLEREKWPGISVADTEANELGNAFGVVGFPYVIYVNADGTVAARTSGEQDAEVIAENAKAISNR